MNINSNGRRALIRSIKISADANSQTIVQALEGILSARYTQIVKGSGNKILTSTSADGENISYSIAAGGLTDSDIQEFASMCLDCIAWLAIEYPSVTSNADILSYLLQMDEFNGVSSFVRYRYNT